MSYAKKKNHNMIIVSNSAHMTKATLKGLLNQKFC